jgi:hypothetical protein
VRPRCADPWKGLFAGLAGGLVASFVMNQFQQLWTELPGSENEARRHDDQGGQVQKSEAQRRSEREHGESATQKAARKVFRTFFDRDPDEKEKKRLGTLIHYGFGGATGAAYGAAVEIEPAVSTGAGTSFGAAVWALADEVAVPASGLSKFPTEYPLSVHAQSFFTHLVYGAMTDGVRRMVREIL